MINKIIKAIWARLSRPMSKPTKEAIKGFFRVVLLAIIPILITGLTSNFIDWRVIFVTGSVAGLMFIDKWLHETGKQIEKTQTAESPLTKGLTRF